MSTERLTYRERREARAERLRDWAEKREASAASEYQTAHNATAGIPFGQPILVGHHSERRHRGALARADRAMRASVDDANKADEMRSKAANIEAAADTAIYSDDPDAIERLTAKIAGLEAERARIKAYNASCRKAAKTDGVGDLSLLDDQQRASIASTARHCAYQIGKGGAAPAYWAANLGGNIGRLRKRLAQLERERDHGPADRIIRARFTSSCELCGAELAKDSMIRYNRQAGARCVTCEGAA